jgi:APA family basic amino acid/polyamine antiporter
VMLIISLAFLVSAIVQDISSSQYALLFLVISYPVFLAVQRLNR